MEREDDLYGDLRILRLRGEQPASPGENRKYLLWHL